MVYVLADAPLAHLLHRRPRTLSLPTGHAPIASGGSNSCRVGYLPPTGSTCPFHGARFFRVRLISISEASEIGLLGPADRLFTRPALPCTRFLSLAASCPQRIAVRLLRKRSVTSSPRTTAPKSW